MLQLFSILWSAKPPPPPPGPGLNCPAPPGAESQERRHLLCGNAAAFWLIRSTTCYHLPLLLRSPQRHKVHKGLTKKIIKFESGISFAFSSLCVLCDLCVFVVKIVTHRFSYPIHQHRHASGPTRSSTLILRQNLQAFRSGRHSTVTRADSTRPCNRPQGNCHVGRRCQPGQLR